MEMWKQFVNSFGACRNLKERQDQNEKHFMAFLLLSQMAYRELNCLGNFTQELLADLFDFIFRNNYLIAFFN